MNTQSSTPAPSERRRNPYVGPVPFETADRTYFFGRDQEIAILQGLVLASREMLFFAQSGAGKSSLLRAGILPALTAQTRVGRGAQARLFQPMQVLPLTRVSGIASVEIEAQATNIYTFYALLGLLPQRTSDELTQWTLVDGLRDYRDITLAEGEMSSATHAFSLAANGRANATLLIFDQFEELFTAYPERWRERELFFRQVSEALSTFPLLHVLFTMREDYIAELTPYAQLLPDQLQHRFRMERMKRDAALLAVREPANRAGCTFAEGVAETLVENLARVQVTQHALHPADEEKTSEPLFVVGDYVEPVHLQIVCHQLWEKLTPEQHEIQHADVQRFGDVDQALITFYDEALQAVVKTNHCSERKLRDWFSQRLVTSARTRGLLYYDEARGTTEGQSNLIVDALRDVYLIRSTLRGGDTWIELAHDRLIDPILNTNQRWQVAFANPLTAALAQGRENAPLLTGDSLNRARVFAQAHTIDLTEDEQEFLDSSIQQEQQEQASRLQRRNLQISAIVVALIITAIGLWAIFNANIAKDATVRQQANQQAGAALQALSNNNIESAILLALQSNRTKNTNQGLSILRQALEYPVHTQYLFGGHLDGFNSIRWSPKGDKLASMNRDETVRIWSVISGKELLKPFPHAGNVLDARWNPTGQQLLTWTNRGQLLLWNALQNEEPLVLGTRQKSVLDANFSPDGQTVASAEADGFVRLWNHQDGSLRHEFKLYALSTRAVVWSQDGNRLLTSGRDEETAGVTLVRLLSLQTATITTLIEMPGGVGKPQWNQDESKILTTSTLSDTTSIWDSRDGSLLQKLDGGSLPSEWDRSGEYILTVDAFGLVHYYNSNDGRQLFSVQTPYSASVMRLHEDGKQFLIADFDNVTNRSLVHLWQPTSVNGHLSWNKLTLADANPKQTINDLRWQPGGELFAVASADQSLRVYKKQPRYELPAFLHDGVARVATVLEKDRLLTAGGNSADISDLNSGIRLATFVHDQPILSAKLSPNGKFLLTAGEGGIVHVWDVTTGQELNRVQTDATRIPYAWWVWDDEHIYLGYENSDSHQYSIQFWTLTKPPTLQYALGAHSDFIRELYWKSDYSQMATSSQDGTVGIWNPTNGALIKQLFHNEGITQTQSAPVLKALWIHKDRHLLTYGEDGLARLWDTTTWQPVITMIHASKITAFNYDDEERLVSGEANGTVHIWNGSTGREIYQLTGAADEITVLRWNRNKNVLLVASADGSLRLWNAQGGKQDLIILGHMDRVNSAVWNQAESKILSASNDGSAHIWDTRTGEELVNFDGFGSAVLDARWIQNETKVLLRTFGGQVRLYHTDPQAVLDFACQQVVRNLTQEEWNRFIGNEVYQKTCPQFPNN